MPTQGVLSATNNPPAWDETEPWEAPPPAWEETAPLPSIRSGEPDWSKEQPVESAPIFGPEPFRWMMENTPNAYTISKALPLPDSLREGIEGYKDTLAEGISGMTDPKNIAMLPAFAIPYLGPALGMGLGAKTIGAGAGKTVAAIEQDNPREIGSGLGEVGFGASMLVPGAMQAFRKTPPAAPSVIEVETVKPAPPIITEAVKQGEQIGLTKSVEALKAKETPPIAKSEPISSSSVVPDIAKDIARFNELESQVAQMRQGSPAMEVMASPEYQALATEQQAIKNRYGGQKPSDATVPDTAGENVAMRKSAARATEAPMIPEPVQDTIKTAPESFYKQQSTDRVETTVKGMSDVELGSVPADSNLYVASRLEQADRLFKAGNNEAGYNVFVELEKQGTSFGQNINQFKRLAGTMPEYIPRIIDQKLTKAGKDPLTPPQTKVITDLARDSKTKDSALDETTEAWQKNPTTENAAKAERAQAEAEASALKLQSQVNKFTPRTTAAVLKAALQGNLLTPISEVANIFGNMSFSPFRAMDRTIAAGLDAIDAFIRNKPRELTVQPLRGTMEAAKGAGRGLKQIPAILARGAGDTIKGESRAGLHPIRAWVDQFAKNPDRPTVGGKLGLQERVNMAIEGTFGVPAEAMLRGLGAGDMPFREAARARVTASYLKLKGVPKKDWALAQKFPELFLDLETRTKIQEETIGAIFQRDSKTLNIFTHWLRGKGDWFDLAVATVAPYKLTPWNIIAEILSYNPLVATAKTVRDAATGNSKSAKLNAGKFAVGSMLTATGYWLYSKGLLAPSLDERDEAQKARMLAGDTLPPNHINLSGLKRALEGGDPALKPGDETVDVMRAGGLAGSVLYMTANIGREFERKPAVGDSDLWLAILRQSTLEQARFGLNQSFLSGVEGALTAIKDGNTDSYVRQWANTVSSVPLPNTLGTISRASREYKPDLKADTFAKQMENIARNKLGFAGLDDYMPLKRDLWGQPMLETPKDRNAILYQFFDISKNRQVTDDPVPLELYRLWRKTGDTKVIPSIPEKTLTIGRQNFVLTTEQQSRFAELVGSARREIVDAIVINPNFYKLPDEAKVKLLDDVYRTGLQQGKVKLWQEMQGQLAPKPNRSGFNPE